MKNIQDILKRKVSQKRRPGSRVLDEKTIARVFLEAAKHEIKNLEDADIREMKLKEKTLYIKTAHPVVSSELMLRRKNILSQGNEFAGKKMVEKMIA